MWLTIAQCRTVISKLVFWLLREGLHSISPLRTWTVGMLKTSDVIRRCLSARMPALQHYLVESVL